MMASGYKEENRLTAPALSKRAARTNCHLNRWLCYDRRMKLRSALGAAAGVVLAVVAGITGFGQSAGPEMKVGDPAPAFNLPGSDGKPHQLADHKGKRAVVLAWFPKAFTGG